MGRELPPEIRFFERRLRLSIEKVDCALSEACEIRRLSDEEMKRLAPGMAYVAAWDVLHGRIEQAPSLIVALDGSFPATIPHLYLPEAERWFLKVPHVDQKGTLCVLPSHAVIDQFNCGDAVVEMVERGINTMEQGLGGGNEEEFVRETEGYWAQISTDPAIVCTATISGPSRRFEGTWLRGGKSLLVAENREALANWHFGLTGLRPTSTFDVPFVWRDTPLCPDAYPATNEDVFELIAASGLDHLRDAAMRARKGPLHVIIGFQTTTGVAAIATSIRGFDQAVKGYRSRSITGEMLAQRWGGISCGRHVVDRATPEWLHWRGGADQDRKSISTANILIVGCGAVGADVAMLLAKAGVRNLTLVDREILKMENIGRHFLGARWVGLPKAVALARALSNHFPHMQIKHAVAGIESLCRERSAVLGEYDLIVCMTADWMGESALNLWARRFSTKPVLYGWLEPHGFVGHGLLVTGDGGCLACGRDEYGRVREPVTEWREEPIMQVPACGGWFTPHGAIDSGPAKEMLAQLALDSLTGVAHDSTQRVFIGDHKRIISLGGSLRPSWRSYCEDAAFLNRTISLPWPANQKCPLCKTQTSN